jgi:hypothetical protein
MRSILPTLPFCLLRSVLLLAFELRSDAKKVMFYASFLLLTRVFMPTWLLTMWRGSCTSRSLLGSDTGMVTGGTLAESVMHG